MAITLYALLTSIMLARALFVAAELNLAEELAKQPLSAEELAIITGTNPSALSRLLNFLSLNDVFRKENDQKYYLTDFSHTMRSDHPDSIKPFLLHDDETRWNAFGNLGYSIRTGKASFDELYGTDYFNYLKKHPTLSERFDQAMTIISAQEDAYIANTLPFYGTVADIGGGNGQLINALAQKGVISKGILIDLPGAVEAAQLGTNCIKIAGSFFEPLRIKADAFILKRILHDWDNEKALLILKNVRATMNTDSKLYIIDGILDQAEDQKALAAIDLALLTIFQGAERTLETITELLKQADLEIIQIFKINSLLSAIECQSKTN